MNFQDIKKQSLGSSFFITLLFSVLGFAYVLLITKDFAPGISQDSVSYFAAAKNILAGNGITMQAGDGSYVLVTHWPPLYPMTLAFTSYVTGADCLESSRYLSAALFALSLLLLNLIFIKCQLGSFVEVMMNIFFFISPITGEFLMTDSEPLFIFLLLIHCYMFIYYLNESRKTFLFASGLTAGFFLITRYAGAGFIAGTVLFLFFQKENIKTKFLRILIYLLPVLVVMLSWIVYAKLHADNPTDRSMVFHLVSLKHLKTLLGIVLFWISPAFRFVLGPLIIALIALFLFNRKTLAKQILFPVDDKTRFFTWLIASYCIFLVISISLFDFSTNFNNRMMSPLYPLILLSLIPILKEENKKYLFYSIIVLMLFSNTINFFKVSKDFYENGNGFNGIEWKQSELMNKLKNADPQKSIFTNGEYVIPFLTDRYKGVFPFPKILSSNTTLKNPLFKEEMDALKSKIKSGDGIVVYFDEVKRFYLPGRNFIEKEFEGFNFEKTGDGLIIY